jgi:competence protein ComEC
VGAALALAAFVAGAWFLQQQVLLPSPWVLGACSALGLAVLLVCVALLRRARRGGGAQLPAPFARCGVVLAAFALGAPQAAALALWQLADELAFVDEGRDVLLSGVVASLPAQLLRGTRFEFDVESVEPAGVHVPAHISLGWYAPSAKVRPGERWRFGARLRRPHGTLNPGGFDLEAWMLERNLRAAGYVRDVASTPPERRDLMLWRPGYAIDRLRDALRERLQARLQQALYGGVLIALVVGDQRAIGEDDWLLFNRTGISHLVSISGLHITMIAGLVAFAVAAG